MIRGDKNMIRGNTVSISGDRVSISRDMNMIRQATCTGSGRQGKGQWTQERD